MTLSPWQMRGLCSQRETERPATSVPVQVAWIAQLTDFAGIRSCLYAALQQNIRPLTSQKLAELTVCSATATAGATRCDCILYLQQQKHRGAVTTLMSPYEEAVLGLDETGRVTYSVTRQRHGTSGSP